MGAGQQILLSLHDQGGDLGIAQSIPCVGDFYLPLGGDPRQYHHHAASRRASAGSCGLCWHRVIRALFVPGAKDHDNHKRRSTASAQELPLQS